jgi:hypothetical protein
MRRFVLLSGCCVGILACSCAHRDNKSGPTTRPMSLQERQDRALHDPFGYKPDFTGTGVSGGDTGAFDKEGLRKDIEDVFIK